METYSIRHGDVHLIPSSLPKLATKLFDSSEFILAHGETGHVHRLKTKQPMQVWESNGVRYIVVPVGDPGVLTHQEHETQEVPAGVYRQGQEIEYDPFSEAIRQVAD